MTLALEMSEMPETSDSQEISDQGRRAVNAYIASTASALKVSLQESGAFAPWEIRAIIQSVVEVVQQEGELKSDLLEKSLFSRSVPKDLSHQLAKALSN